VYTTTSSSNISASYSRGLVIILVSVNASVKLLIRSPLGVYFTSWRVVVNDSLAPSCGFFTNDVGEYLDIWQLKLPFAYTSKGLNLRLGTIAQNYLLVNYYLRPLNLLFEPLLLTGPGVAPPLSDQP
jgi:hypothetical protein